MTTRIARRPMALAVAALIGVIALTACGSAAAPAEPTVRSDSSNALNTSPPGFPDVVPLEEPLKAPKGVPEEIETVWEVWKLLTNEHVRRSELDPDEFAEAAIRGMLGALDDPHTNYVGPEAFAIDSEDLRGKFEGIGANVSMTRDGKLVVVAPIKGGPADQAGVRPGDVIVEVDGESISDLSLLGAVALIRGPEGTRVRLLIRHIGAIDPILIEVERGVIPLESVALRSEPGSKIAHIRITNFYADTADKLSETIKTALDDGAEGLIVDVRDNPGGLLNSVVDVTSLFLEDGLILYEVDGQGKRKDWEVRKEAIAADVPMVLLANEFSASASEILVGALQDHERAIMIGATTFGKGSVNILRQLSNGGGLVVTVARWYTPMGRLIQGNGLAPDVNVTSRDRRQAEALQLEEAIKYLEDETRVKSQSQSPGT